MGLAAALTPSGDGPTFSIVVPVDGPAVGLRSVVASVVAQSHARWELLLVTRGDTTPVTCAEAKVLAASDSRIIVVPTTANTRTAAINTGFARARGPFVTLLGTSDRLVPTALACVDEALAAEPTIDVLYTDEAAIAADGSVLSRFFKPDWSPERLRSQCYCSRLCVLRRALVDALGGMDAEYEPAEEYDLLLRSSERARRIHHLPIVLCHRLDGLGPFRRDRDSTEESAACRAVAAHLTRLGLSASVKPGAVVGTQRVGRVLRGSPSVSVIIPTAGVAREVWAVERPLVVRAVQSIIEATDERDLELIVVADSETPGPICQQLSGLGAVVIPGDGPFNYSRRCNQGVAASSGEYIILLNDDTFVEQHDWITVMLGFFAEPDVGVVGARLLYSDGTLQHAGVLLNEEILHIFRGFGREDPGPFGLLQIDREVGAVTGACLATTRRIWNELGGLADEFAVAYNDIDFCLRARATGRRVIWTPHATLYHFESQSRGHVLDPEETRLMSSRWGYQLWADPYGNPNLAPGQAEWRPSDQGAPLWATKRLIRRLLN